MMTSFPQHSRYTDQPTSLRTRLVGTGGTVAVAAVVLGGALFSWPQFHGAQPRAALVVFNVAPPAAPPEPVREIPPGPEQVRKEKPQPEVEKPPIEPPEIQLPSSNPMAMPRTEPVVDPGPPVKETTAPPAKPLPPAQQISTGKPTWEGLVLGALNKVKRYPFAAASRRQQGVPYIRFVIDRQGRLLSARLERSCGFAALDNEALALPRRAQPLPKPPEEVKGDTIELVVPVEFFMR